MLPKDKNRFALDLMVVATVCMAVAFLSSCVTVEKAKKTMDENPADASAYCADRYPVKEEVDTLWIEVDKTDYDAIRRLEEENEELQRRLDYLEGLPEKIDSATCESLRKMYIVDTKKYQQQILTIKKMLSNQKDSMMKIKATIVDSAKLAALRAKFERVVAEKDKEISKLQSAKSAVEIKSKSRLRNLFISIGVNLLLAVALGFVLGKKINIGLFKNKKP